MRVLEKRNGVLLSIKIPPPLVPARLFEIVELLMKVAAEEMDKAPLLPLASLSQAVTLLMRTGPSPTSMPPPFPFPPRTLLPAKVQFSTEEGKLNSTAPPFELDELFVKVLLRKNRV